MRLVQQEVQQHGGNTANGNTAVADELHGNREFAVEARTAYWNHGYAYADGNSHHIASGFGHSYQHNQGHGYTGSRIKGWQAKGKWGGNAQRCCLGNWGEIYIAHEAGDDGTQNQAQQYGNVAKEASKAVSTGVVFHLRDELKMTRKFLLKFSCYAI